VLLCALLGVVAAVALVAQAQASHSAKSSAATHRAPPRAHAASVFLTGIGDEQSQMFSDPDWQRLHTKIARYIAP